MGVSSGSSRSNESEVVDVDVDGDDAPSPTSSAPASSEEEEEEFELDSRIAWAQTSKTFHVPASEEAVESAVERLEKRGGADDDDEEEGEGEGEGEEEDASCASLPSASGDPTAHDETSPSGRHCHASLVTRMRSGVMSSSSPSVFEREREREELR